MATELDEVVVALSRMPKDAVAATESDCRGAAPFRILSCSATKEEHAFAVWASAHMFARLFDAPTSPVKQLLSRAGSIIELGAGTGILSMHLAAEFQKRCIVTDLPHVIPVLQRTVALPANAAIFASRAAPPPIPAAFTWGELPETLLRSLKPAPCAASARLTTSGADGAAGGAGSASTAAVAAEASHAPAPLLSAPCCIVGTDCVFSQYMAAPLVRSIAQLAFIAELTAAAAAVAATHWATSACAGVKAKRRRGICSGSGSDQRSETRCRIHHDSGVEHADDVDGGAGASGGRGVAAGVGSAAAACGCRASTIASEHRQRKLHHLPQPCHVLLLNQLRETATQSDFEAAAGRWFRVQRNGLARWLPDVDPRHSDFRLYRMRLRAGLCAADVGLGVGSLLACGIDVADGSPGLFCGDCRAAAADLSRPSAVTLLTAAAGALYPEDYDAVVAGGAAAVHRGDQDDRGAAEAGAASGCRVSRSGLSVSVTGEASAGLAAAAASPDPVGPVHQLDPSPSRPGRVGDSEQRCAFCFCCGAGGRAVAVTAAQSHDAADSGCRAQLHGGGDGGGSSESAARTAGAACVKTLEARDHGGRASRASARLMTANPMLLRMSGLL